MSDTLPPTEPVWPPPPTVEPPTRPAFPTYLTGHPVSDALAGFTMGVGACFAPAFLISGVWHFSAGALGRAALTFAVAVILSALLSETARKRFPLLAQAAAVGSIIMIGVMFILWRRALAL